VLQISLAVRRRKYGCALAADGARLLLASALAREPDRVWNLQAHGATTPRQQASRHIFQQYRGRKLIRDMAG